MCNSLSVIFFLFVLLGLQRRRLIPALTLDSSSSSPSHRSSKQAITSSSSSSSSPGACWVDGPLGPPAPSNLRAVTATTETFEIKVYEIDDVERLQKRKDKGGSKVRGRREERHLSCTAVVGQVVEQVNKLQGWRFDPYLFLPVCQHVLEQKSKWVMGKR